MSVPAEAERVARAALTWVAEPGDQAMGALLRVCPPAEVVTALIEGRAPRLSDVAGIPRLERALPRWAARLGDVPPEPALDRWRRNGIRPGGHSLTSAPRSRMDRNSPPWPIG